MRYLLYGVIIIACMHMAGCVHTHSVVTVDAEGNVERIKTRYRYRIVERSAMDKKMLLDIHTDAFAEFQPDVFNSAGIPVELAEDTITLKKKDQALCILGPLTFWTFPAVETLHENKLLSFKIAYTNGLGMSARTCGHAISSMANNPLPLLISYWGSTGCIKNGQTFSGHNYDMNQIHVDYLIEKRARAYAIAARLKELEDSGRITDLLAAKVMLAHRLSRVLQGNVDYGNVDMCPFEINELENEGDHDFAYRFSLSKKKVGGLTPLDVNEIRNAFHAVIRSIYVMKHWELNPRALAVDFVEFTVTDGHIRGKVVVVTTEVDSVSYDSVSRKGRIAVRVNVNQLDDARRLIRKRIGEFASRSNIVVEGDEIPSGARFYTGSETLKENGILEVDFRTE